MKVYYSTSRDPYFHLALEDYLLRETQEEAWIFYINSPCIVMGRFQNPWMESHVSWLQSQNIPLVRRMSGGGTVWHDEGNINFCKIGPLKNFKKETALEFLKNHLFPLGVFLHRNTRFDLGVMVDNEWFKCSGSAFKQTKDRALHHGTLLFKANLDFLNHSLSATESIGNSLSIKSVRSKVKNISEAYSHFSMNDFLESLKLISDEWIEVDEQTFSLQPMIANWKSWDWLWGETPYFEWNIETPNKDLSICFKLRKGRVEETLLKSSLRESALPFKGEALTFENFKKVFPSELFFDENFWQLKFP